MTCDGMRMQVVVETAVVYMCVKLRVIPLERTDIDGASQAVVDEATLLFLERATNDSEPEIKEMFFVVNVVFCMRSASVI